MDPRKWTGYRRPQPYTPCRCPYGWKSCRYQCGWNSLGKVIWSVRTLISTQNYLSATRPTKWISWVTLKLGLCFVDSPLTGKNGTGGWGLGTNVELLRESLAFTGKNETGCWRWRTNVEQKDNEQNARSGNVGVLDNLLYSGLNHISGNSFLTLRYFNAICLNLS